MKTIRTLLLAFCTALLALANTTDLHAQCPLTNTAFLPGENLEYQLYFNWKFIWIKAGTANLQITQRKYNGQDALRCHLITTGSKRTDSCTGSIHTKLRCRLNNLGRRSFSKFSVV